MVHGDALSPAFEIIRIEMSRAEPLDVGGTYEVEMAVALMSAPGSGGPEVSMQSSDGVTIVEFGLEPPFTQSSPPLLTLDDFPFQDTRVSWSAQGTLWSCQIFAPNSDVVCGLFDVSLRFEAAISN